LGVMARVGVVWLGLARVGTWGIPTLGGGREGEVGAGAAGEGMARGKALRRKRCRVLSDCVGLSGVGVVLIEVGGPERENSVRAHGASTSWGGGARP
jgi:hypothetical protein